jgi:hypothetical protein
MTGQIIFDPLVGWPVLAGLAALVLLGTLYALWRGLAGWWLRLLAGLVLLAGIANPSLQQEDRERLTDIVVAVVDDSASQQIGDRAAQTAAALAALQDRIAARPDTELRVVHVTDAPDNGGSLVMTGLAGALAEEPQGRIAGIVLITDGRIHDADRAPPLPAPLHTLLTGEPQDWDRRLVIENAPAFAILGCGSRIRAPRPAPLPRR